MATHPAIFSFSVQKFPDPVRISSDKPLTVSIHFQPRNDIGSYEDVLIFNFKTRQGRGGQEEFSIQRTIRGSVGIKEDVEKFAAKIPYVKPELDKRPRADKKKTVKAPRDEFKQNLPWTGKLPWYPTPKWLARQLETLTIGEVIKDLRRSLKSLSYENYSRYWTIVLYLEAHQEE